MICIVRCSKKMRVRLPSGVHKTAGDTVPCPGGCRMKNGFCSGIQEFKVESSMEAESDNKAIVYTDEEIARHWGSISPASEPKNADIAELEDSFEEYYPAREENLKDSSEDEYIPTHSYTEEDSTAKTAEQTVAKYSFDDEDFEEDLPPKSEEKKEEYISVDKNLYPGISIGGKKYSPLAQGMTGTLESALDYIFRHWMVNMVFERTSDTLSEKFLWLLTCTSKRKIPKKEVDKILENEEYTRNQKFFYLFYDVVYKNELSKGFYWSDSFKMEALTSMFTDMNDFVKKYFQKGDAGESFRRFYNEHRGEIHHYLYIEDDGEFLESHLLKSTAKTGSIKYMEENGTVTDLGTVKGFIKDMSNPKCDYERKKQMIKYLRKYRITSDGDILPRRSGELFEYKIDGERIIDKAYSVLGLSAPSRYLDEYECYITLLKEYMRVFKPSSVSVGEITFSRKNYSRELNEIVRDFCEVLFGINVDSRDADRIMSIACLAKVMFEDDVFGFVCENRDAISRLMTMVSFDSRKEIGVSEIKRYFEMFSDEAYIRIRNNRVKIPQYIKEKLKTESNPYTISENIENDIIVKAYLTSKCNEEQIKTINDTFKKYDELYKSFSKKG